MRILLFGATGRVGRRVLEAALADGHDVTAFARDGTDLPDAVTTVVGDVTDVDAVGSAVPGHDAVVSAFGPRHGDDPSVLDEGMANVVRTMTEAGVDRLVAVAAAGILQATPTRLRLETDDFPDRLRVIATAHRRAAEHVRGSSLAWTLVCPPYMPDGVATNHYRTERNYLPNGGQSVSVGDVATCVYEILVDGTHVRQRVGIAY